MSDTPDPTPDSVEAHLNRYAREGVDLMAQGALLLSQMVQHDLYSEVAPHFPPPPIMEWYALTVANHFCQLELKVATSPAPDEATKDSLAGATSEIKTLRQMISKNSMLGLGHKIDQMLKARMLHLPTGYIPKIR